MNSKWQNFDINDIFSVDPCKIQNAETQWFLNFKRCLINMFYIGVIIAFSSQGFSEGYFQKGLSSQSLAFARRVFLKGPAGFGETRRRISRKQ